MAYSNYERWRSEPLTEEPYLSIVIPTRNVAEQIVPTLGAVAVHVADLGFPWELIIADAGSTDQTIATVQALGFANVRIVPADGSADDNATRRGVLAARGRYVLVLDAENSTPIEEVGKLLATTEGADSAIAVGTRQPASGPPPTRWGLRDIWGLARRAVPSACRLYPRALAQQLLSAQTLPQPAGDLEILFVAAKLGYRIAEVPVQWIAPPAPPAPLRPRDLFRVWLNNRQGVYARAQAAA